MSEYKMGDILKTKQTPLLWLSVIDDMVVGVGHYQEPRFNIKSMGSGEVTEHWYEDEIYQNYDLLKPVPGYNKYYVSDNGEVISFKYNKPRKMKHMKSKSGHHYVFLYKESIMKKRWVHHLVLTAWGRPRREGQEVRHLDGVPYNNFLNNLCWGTRQENSNDRVKHGNSMKGEDAPGHKLNERDVRVIRNCRGSMSSREIGRVYGVSHTTILSIFSRKNWGHI